MVFESRVGETFLLGASTWRIEQITHDRVLVSPAPGEPGKMPFWKADAAGRPLELGRYIGEMVRALGQMPAAGAVERLVRHHDLDHQAAENLIRYLNDQKNAVGVVPDDKTILIERCRDELGDWRDLRPDSVRRKDPRAVGDGGRGANESANGPGRRDDVDRRRVRRPVPGDGGASGSALDGAICRGSRVARSEATWRDRTFRGEVS